MKRARKKRMFARIRVTQSKTIISALKRRSATRNLLSNASLNFILDSIRFYLPIFFKNNSFMLIQPNLKKKNQTFKSNMRQLFKKESKMVRLSLLMSLPEDFNRVEDGQRVYIRQLKQKKVLRLVRKQRLLLL